MWGAASPRRRSFLILDGDIARDCDENKLHMPSASRRGWASPTRRPRFGRAARDGGDPLQAPAAEAHVIANASFLHTRVTPSGASRRVGAKAHPPREPLRELPGPDGRSHYNTVLALSSRRTRTRQDEIDKASR